MQIPIAIYYSVYNTQMQLRIGKPAVTSYRTHIVNRESEINIMQMGVFYALSTVSLMLGYILVKLWQLIHYVCT